MEAFMKMIRAIVRPEKVDEITDGLSESGFYSMTKYNVFGRGKQKGISVGTVHYDELPKTLIMLVVTDESVDEVIKIISYKAYTGNFGDGKIFISAVEDAYTVRTGKKSL
jgi:Nitrogen regulatory protein PII